jgi:hypothetical protein
MAAIRTAIDGLVTSKEPITGGSLKDLGEPSSSRPAASPDTVDRGLADRPPQRETVSTIATASESTKTMSRPAADGQGTGDPEPGPIADAQGSNVTSRTTVPIAIVSAFHASSGDPGEADGHDHRTPEGTVRDHESERVASPDRRVASQADPHVRPGSLTDGPAAVAGEAQSEIRGPMVSGLSRDIPLGASTVAIHAAIKSSIASPPPQVNAASGINTGDAAEIPEILNQIRLQLSPVRPEMTVLLDPPDLGRLLVRLEVQAGHVQALITADDVRVARTIGADLPRLVQTLEEAGLKVHGVEIRAKDEDSSLAGRSFDAGIPARDPGYDRRDGTEDRPDPAEPARNSPGPDRPVRRAAVAGAGGLDLIV